MFGRSNKPKKAPVDYGYELGPSFEDWVDAEEQTWVREVWGEGAVDDDLTLLEMIQQGKIKIPIGGVMVADDPGELGVVRYGNPENLSDEETMAFALAGVKMANQAWAESESARSSSS